MAEEHSRLMDLLTSDLESKLSKGFTKFKKQVEKEIIKHDAGYPEYKRDRELSRDGAVKEMEELRSKRIRMLEEQLAEVRSLINKMKFEFLKNQNMDNIEEMTKYRCLEHRQYIINNRLQRCLEEDWSQYGVEIEEEPSDSDLGSYFEFLPEPFEEGLSSEHGEDVLYHSVDEDSPRHRKE